MDAIEVQGLVKRFGAVSAIDGIDFTVAKGTVFGLLGPNGAGKTTTVRVLSTILPPDAGTASVLGYDTTRDARTVRTLIGLAGQYAAVDPNLTGLENLRLMGRLAHIPRAEIRPRASELLERFGLSDAADRTVKTYSGGMRRRLDLAASLVHKPPVLFLDEPTTGLDIQGRTELWDTIREQVADGTTVLLTTQYLEEADRLAQRIAVVDGGRVVANDTPEALKARMGKTVIEITFDRPTAAAEAIAALGRMGAEHEGSVVRVQSNGGAQVLMEVLRALDAARLEPATLTVREPSLDDAFLALTGHRAAAASAAEAGAA